MIEERPIDTANTCFLVDDFFENPDEIADHAASHRDRFVMPRRSYPGLVLDLAADQFDEVSRFLRFRMSRLLAYGRSGVKTSAQLSLTTLQPQKFSWIQRLPHTDPRPEAGRRNFALLVYLFNKESLGGTGFYRWRDEEFLQQAAALQQQDPNGGFDLVRERYAMFDQPPCYMTGSNDAAELLTVIPARYNRMICYSGEVPHSAYIQDAALLSDDCRSGRLTFNAFASVIPVL